jgi:ATP-dependent Lhr-like helicase
VRDWFATTFAEPTRAQQLGWQAIGEGQHTLLLAPTGSGKTLAAFLWAIDRLATSDEDAVPGRVLYVSPLKALAVDIERNLRAPLVGLQRSAARLGVDVRVPTVGVRTGDTSADERRRLARTPPDILITTPESLYLMLTSRAREGLRGVRWVIVDEIHAVAGTKRGAHLALSLERLEELTRVPPQRIGLSATQRPLDEIARFLGGADADGPRPVTVVDAGSGKELDVEVVVPVEDLGAMGRELDEPVSGPAAAGPPRASVWPHVYPRLLDLVLAHRSTIVFVNARRLAERVAAQLNDLWREQLAAAGEEPPADVELVRAHHGSIAREQRVAIEDALKRGEVRGLVATSSLELGIDMGAVDLVVQVESPGSVARGLQRIGRAGHGVGEASRGKIFPKYRGDLLEAAVVVPRMRAGLVEETRYPRNPLDVLAQQLVAACALDEWEVDALLALVRRAANFADLPDDAFTAVLDLLTGRYPSDEFSGLRPRLVWDRVAGRVRAREGAARVAVVNGGTIPDRGLFGVFLPDGVRVGELDEEMVYESRPGDVFVLGASTWRMEQITHDRVIVTPAPGEPGRSPFWKGDKPGRPLELGRALGATTRELVAVDGEQAERRLRDEFALDELAASNLRRYLDEQRDATGAVPDDRTVVVERFPDEIGDWRVCVLSPFGARVHAPWALALEARLAERLDLPVEVLWSDDGIVLRLPEALDTIPADELLLDPDEVEELVTRQLPATALFAARFREAAARALLLPRRRPGERTPLWQQRQRAADLLEVAARYPSFPIVLEATRECLRDVFDLAALRSVLADLRSRRVRVVPVETRAASPFAQSLLFGWIAVYMYEGDAPLAERRAAALALDRDLLRELLGAEELRELLDADSVAAVELEVARLAPGSRRARSADDLHDLLRVLGDLSTVELAPRVEGDTEALVAELERERRAIRVTVAGTPRVAAADDASRYRDALGAAIPIGLPAVFTEPVDDPLGDLLARYARTRGPFTTDEAASRFGVPGTEARVTLERLEQRGRVVRGEFRPAGAGREWCDVEVLRRLRRRSLAALRREIEPVEPPVYARFALAWQGIASPRRGTDALVDALSQLQGAAIPASVLETDVLASRVDRYRPSMLDELCASGDVVWIGAGATGATDGRVVLCFRDQASLLAPAATEPPAGPVADALRAHLERAGASFWPELLRAAGEPDERVVLDALWELAWAGVVTNDGLGALRARLAGRPRAPRGRPPPGRLTRLGPPAAAGRWSLVATSVGTAPSNTEVTMARARQLLDRHGVVTRETVRAEGWPGGFAAVYPALRAMEDAGRARRGYFVAGLGAAQFALPGAADRLRGERAADSAPVVVAATDPAQLYGAALPWPDSAGRPVRVPGALVALDGGAPVAYLEKGARRLLTFGADPALWIEALTDLVKNGRLRALTLERVDDVPTRESPAAVSLRSAGFVDSYRGLRFGP